MTTWHAARRRAARYGGWCAAVLAWADAFEVIHALSTFVAGLEVPW